MKYYIQRQLSEYGPYTLADMQRYVAQGSILLTDLTRSEGMTEWVPVSQVIGNIPAPTPLPPVQSADLTIASGGAAAYSGTGTIHDGLSTTYGGNTLSPQSNALVPPDFHWALVFLISCFCGIFQMIWLFVEASFVRKLDPENKGMAFLISAIVVQVVACIVFFSSINSFMSERDGFPAFFVPMMLLGLASVVLHLMGIFKMRSAIENYYNTVEPINLRLSGVMTFFFAVFYFQYHFTRIANWKRTGQLQPQ